MSNLTLFDWKSQNIRFKTIDGVVWGCLTDMAKATGKKVNDWYRLNSTTEYLTALKNTGKLPDSIIEINESKGSNDKRGTWAIEEVAIDFAMWCDVKFRIWVNRTIKTLLTESKGEIEKVSRYQSMPAHIQLIEFNNALENFGIDLTNPRVQPKIKGFVWRHSWFKSKSIVAKYR